MKQFIFVNYLYFINHKYLHSYRHLIVLIEYWNSIN